MHARWRTVFPSAFCMSTIAPAFLTINACQMENSLPLSILHVYFSRFLGLCSSIIPFSHAVKPMKKTVKIGLFFFFIHIIVVSDWNIVLKHILGCEYCKCGEGGGRAGHIFPQTFPPPRLCMNCMWGRQPWPALLSPPPPPATQTIWYTLQW